jgi:putative flippase GtrA
MIDKRYLKYIITGFSNVLIGYGIYSGLLLMGFSILTSLVTNYLFGIFYSFIVNARWVFRANGWSRLPLFIVFHISVLFINLRLIDFMLTNSNLEKFSVQALLIFPIAILNFSLMKHFIFRDIR